MRFLTPILYSVDIGTRWTRVYTASDKIIDAPSLESLCYQGMLASEEQCLTLFSQIFDHHPTKIWQPKHLIISTPSTMNRLGVDTFKSCAAKIGFGSASCVPSAIALAAQAGLEDAAVFDLGGGKIEGSHVSSFKIQATITFPGGVEEILDNVWRKLCTRHNDNLSRSHIQTVVLDLLENGRSSVSYSFLDSNRLKKERLTQKEIEMWVLESTHDIYRQLSIFVSKKKDTPLLVAGGGSRIPFLVQTLENELGVKVACMPRSHVAVVLGLLKLARLGKI